LALRLDADVICEKPLVINPWNLDALQELEAETCHRINTVLQLRLHPALLKLRQSLQNEPRGKQHDVMMTYITARGNWYHVSWKGQTEKSGGVATNIGIHFFDLLLWLFGPVGDTRLYYADSKRMSGMMDLERARVRWYLSVDAKDLPFAVEPGGKTTYRSITVDGQEIEFSEGFADLHTLIYQEVLAGRGFGIADARPSVELTYHIRTSPISPFDTLVHPLLKDNHAALTSDANKLRPIYD
jgi:UDP-N-acetyl-2-amino-2-deoxyglucuronate dehydrogenase